jgi:predicted metalloprotease
VIAHEVGHHVQNLLGITDKMEQMRGRVSQVQYNALSVRLELQADCLAGVWAHHAQTTRARSWSRAMSKRP